MEKYKRLETLFNLLEGKPYLNKKELLESFKIHHDLDISARTLERDFKYLATEFHIGIQYDREKRGYHIIEEDRERIGDFLNFAGRMYLADLFKKGLKDFENLQECIKLEDHSAFTGIKYVEPIFLSIQQNRILQFEHFNYFKDTLTNYCIAPLQLREFQGRWYVIGVPLNETHQPKINPSIKTFGLARISDLKIKEISTIHRSNFENQLQKFNKIIGLNYDEGNHQEFIEIAVSPNQYKYLESLPLHLSQFKIGELPDGRVKISLHLIPNYELKIKLLKLGDQIEVLKPMSLREEMKKTIINTLKLYQQK